MRGIILARGSGTRLYPAALAINKQLSPVYNKPMIYYPMSILMLAEIREIMVISSPEYLENYRRLFGTGKDFGLQIAYGVQEQPEGLPQAFDIAADFLNGEAAALILGYNIFYGSVLGRVLRRIRLRTLNLRICSYSQQTSARFP